MLIFLVFDTPTVRHLSAKTGESKRENAAENGGQPKKKACNRLIYRLLVFLKSARDENTTRAENQLVIYSVRHLLAAFLDGEHLSG
jgi:hypothetical protein